MVKPALSFNLGGLALAAFLAAPQAIAQANTAPESLKFEVASIRVATSGFNGVRGGCRGIDSVYGAEEGARRNPASRPLCDHRCAAEPLDRNRLRCQHAGARHC